MKRQLAIETRRRDEMIEITERVQALVDESGVQEGTCFLHCPHTTAGLTIQENADPDVVRDTLAALDRLVPFHHPDYRHAEGNTASHIKAIMFGAGLTIFIEGGRLLLGTWQGIYFCEFDGPRRRRLHAKVLAD